MVDGEMSATIHILNYPEMLSARFKLEQYKKQFAEERKAIRLRLTLAIIEEILNEPQRI